MVYCGKASQGCLGCRTRRIKCDRARPQCTQCVRVRKPCPGYRDPLSLMFRDESSKVIQKAHAQWGLREPPESGESCHSFTSPAARAPNSSSDTASTPPTISETRIQRAVQRSSNPRLPKEVCATPVDKAIQFYIEHYVIGLPDEPRVSQELRGRKWVHSGETCHMMAAVGLAGLCNLTGDRTMSILAKHHYGLALQSVSSSIQKPAELDLEIILRAVVMMAMYEIVRGRDEPASPAQTHIMGGAAIISNSLQVPRAPRREGLRALMQMCFSMVASIQNSLHCSSPDPNVVIPATSFPPVTGAQGSSPLPKTLLDCISMGIAMAPESDLPSAKLISLIVRFVELSALVRSSSHPLVDGHPATTSIIRQALDLDAQLDAWERRQAGTAWAVTERHAPGLFPPQAVLDGRYHVYADMYVARAWNHYRWARILATQLLLEAAERFPSSTATAAAGAGAHPSLLRRRIARLARDTLVSVPTHYRHPVLRRAWRGRQARWRAEHHHPHGGDDNGAPLALDETRGGAGIGIAGVPTLLFEVKIAGCAPGVPRRLRAWALQLLETVWADTGMFQAKVLAGLLRRVVEKEEKEEEEEGEEEEEEDYAEERDADRDGVEEEDEVRSVIVVASSKEGWGSGLMLEGSKRKNERKNWCGQDGMGWD